MMELTKRQIEVTMFAPSGAIENWTLESWQKLIELHHGISRNNFLT